MPFFFIGGNYEGRRIKGRGEGEQVERGEGVEDRVVGEEGLDREG